MLIHRLVACVALLIAGLRAPAQTPASRPPELQVARPDETDPRARIQNVRARPDGLRAAVVAGGCYVYDFGPATTIRSMGPGDNCFLIGRGDRVVITQGNGFRAGDGIRVVDVAFGRTTASLGPVTDVFAVTPAGDRFIAYRSEDGEPGLTVLDTATGYALRRIPVPFAMVTGYSLLTAAGDRVAAITQGESKIRVFSLSSSAELPPVEVPPRESAGECPQVPVFGFSPDAGRMALAFGKNVRILDYPSLRQRLAQTARSCVLDLTFSESGDHLTVTDGDAWNESWTVRPGFQRHSLDGCPRPFFPFYLPSVVACRLDPPSGSLRLLDLATRRSLMDLQVRPAAATGELPPAWLALTPGGRFDASESMWPFLSWQSGQESVPLETYFSEAFYPGVVPAALARGLPRDAVLRPAIARHVPALTLRAGAADPAKPGFVRLTVEGTLPQGVRARGLRVFRDRRLIYLNENPEQASGGFRHELSVRPGNLSAYVFNQDNVRSPAVELKVAGEPAGPSRLPRLHVLAVGINRYDNAALNLRYAAPDAELFAEQMRILPLAAANLEPGETILLTDQQATRAGIRTALQRIGDASGPDDVVFFFYAGHGASDGERFFLVPRDFGFPGPRSALNPDAFVRHTSTLVAGQDLEEALAGIDASLLVVMLDACQSGQALQDSAERRRGPFNARGLAQLAYDKNMVLVAAAQPMEAAREFEWAGHGALTYAFLVEALENGRASTDGGEFISLQAALDYAVSRVPVLDGEASARANRLLVLQAPPERQQRPAYYMRDPEPARKLLLARRRVSTGTPISGTSPRLRPVFAGPANRTSYTFSPDGKTITADRLGAAQLTEVAGGRPVRLFEYFDAGSFSPDGRLIAFSDRTTSEVKVRPSSTGSDSKSWTLPNTAFRLAWGESGSCVAVAAYSRGEVPAPFAKGLRAEAWVIRLDRPQPQFIADLGPTDLVRMGTSSNCRYVWTSVSSGETTRLRLFSTGPQPSEIRDFCPDCYSVRWAFAPDESEAAVAAVGRIRRFALPSGNERPPAADLGRSEIGHRFVGRDLVAFQLDDSESTLVRTWIPPNGARRVDRFPLNTFAGAKLERSPRVEGIHLDAKIVVLAERDREPWIVNLEARTIRQLNGAEIRSIDAAMIHGANQMTLVTTETLGRMLRRSSSPREAGYAKIGLDGADTFLNNRDCDETATQYSLLCGSKGDRTELFLDGRPERVWPKSAPSGSFWNQQANSAFLVRVHPDKAVIVGYGGQSREINIPGLGESTLLALAASGPRAVLYSEKGPVRVIDLESGRVTHEWNPGASTVALADDGTRLALAGPTDPPRILDVQTGAEQARIAIPGFRTAVMKFLPDGRLALFAPEKAMIWDPAANTTLELEIPPSLAAGSNVLFRPSANIQFSTGSRRIAVQMALGSIGLWDTSSGKYLLTIAGFYAENGQPGILAFTPDGWFDATPGAVNAMLWETGPGLLDIAPGEAFYQQRLVPGLVGKVLAGQPVR